MSKKIFMLLFLMTVLISVSAVSAADADGNNDTIVSSSDAEILSAANDVNAIDDLNGNYSDSDKTALANFIAVGKNNENNILSTDNNVLKNENDGGILKETSATWYVDENAAAGGDGKSKATAFQNLEDALNDANNGDTIRIASGTYTGNKNIGLTIDKNLYFEKYGDDEAIFDAQKQNRIWTVTATTININGLTFKNGKSNLDSGGALKFENALSDSCINAIFINNTVGSNNGGGALFFDKALSNSIINSTFISNSAPTYGWGGAIYSNILKNVKIYGEFINNTAYYGGAIYTWSDLHNSVLNATFINNSASYNGGAFYSNSNFVNFTISSAFINNKASYGGAFRFEGSNVTIENSVFVNNTATDQGGAICISKSGISFNDNWWGSNNPDWNYLINDGLQPSSYAVLIGSADSTIINQLSESRLKYAFYRNGTDTLISLPKRPIELSATGGQLENTSGYVSNVFSTKFSSEIYGYYNITATVDNQEIKITVREINIWHVDENAAPGGNGRSKATAFQTLKDALDVAKDDDKIMIASGTYTGTNNTGLTIDKILSFEKYGDDEAIFDAQNQNRIWYVTAANTNINGFTFKNGKTGEKAAALYLAGSGNITNCNFTKNTAYGYAGAICFSESGTVEKCNFTNNQANSGGAIFFYKPNSHVTDCNFIENQAVRGTSNGGAIYFSEYGTVTNCNFISNNGTSTSFADSAYGGAIYFKKSGNVANCNFTNNTLNGVNIGGGAIYFGNGDETCDVTNCNFISNQVHAADVRPSTVSAGYGGAIFCNGDKAIFNAINCTFINNRIDYGPGSAIYCKNCWWCTVEYCIFISNFASYGAAIGSNYECDYLDVKYSIFLNNQATSGVHDIDWDWDSDHSSVNGYSWFGNNANNKNENPSGVNVHRLGRWLYLTATADKVMDSYDVKFTLIAIEGSYFDINLMPKVDLTITSTGGSVDKSIAHYDETIKFIPTEGGTGHVTAETNGASYTIDFKTGDFELLQAAINRAPENSVINLTRNYTYNEFDSITSGVLIDKNLTINGNGFTIDAMGKSRIFNVTVGSVTLINLTLKNGAAEDGGAVYFSSTGSVIDCNFTGNKATGQFGKGGAVYFYGEGSVTNCNFSYNAGSLGGAVYFRDYDTLTNCNFTNNTASSNGGAVYFNRMATVTSCNFESNNAADGGAVYFIARSNVSNCNFTNNRATDSSSNGGAIYSNSGDLTLTNCNFTDNTATKYGGAVYSWSYSYATNCNFTNNTATDGGAVYAKNGDSLTKCNFNDNQATNYGGAVYFDDMGTVTSCNFTNNTATEYGGAVYAKDGGSLTKCNFNDNQATEYGGAVYFDDSGTVTSCNFTNNTATEYGGAVYFKGSGTVTSCNFTNNTATEYGGAVYNIGNDVTFTNCIFAKNMVTVEFSRGGAVFNIGNDVTFTDCSFDHNTADNGDGGAIYNDGDYGTVNNCSFIGNTATLSGGAIVNNGWNLSITGCIFDYNIIIQKDLFSDNSAGGAIEIMKSCTIRDSTFTRNVAVYGGALNFDDLKDSRVVALEIYNCSFIFNRALKDGGAIYIKNADNFISKYCIFLSNKAYADDSGAIYNNADGILKCLEYNWFGNNADNYNITPTDIVGIDLNNWLYLNATADNVIGSFDVEFILMSNDGESVDNNLLPKVNLTITSTGGSVDKRIAHFNETIKFVPIEVGTGSVTAKIEDVSQTITFDVLLIDTSVNVNNDTLNLVVDDTFTVVANTTPEGLNVTYSSNDNSVVTVDDKGNVIAVGVGNATITVKVGGYGIYAENSTDIEVKVLNDASVVAEDMVLKVGENGTISYSTSPSGLNVSFVPDDSGIVSVSDKGVVTALKNGTATVTVYVGDNKNYTMNLTVVTVTVLNNASVVAEDMVLKVGENGTISYSTSPSGLNVSFVPDDSGVISVNETTGVVTALKNGTAAVTVYVGDNKKYAMNLTVVTVTVSLNDASVVAEDMVLKVGENGTIVYSTSPSGLNVSFVPDDSGVISVNETTGVVTALKNGTAAVTVYVGDNKKYAMNSIIVNVTVLNDASVVAEDMVLKVGENGTISYSTSPSGLDVSFVVDNSGVVSVSDNGTVTALKEGNATIIVKVGGDGVYFENSTTVAVTVSKFKTEINIDENVLDLLVRDKHSTGATLIPAEAGNLTYTSSDEKVAKVVNNTIVAVSEGNATITVSFDGDNKYLAAESKTINVKVTKKESSIDIEPKSVEVVAGEDAAITVILPEDATGIVLVDVGDNKYYGDVENGNATVNIAGLTAGDYTAKVIYPGDDKYINASSSVSIKVDEVPEPVDSKVNVTVPDVKAGETAKAVVELPSDATGNVTVRVDGKEAAALIVYGGTVEIPLGELTAGNHTVAVVYSGNSKYSVGVVEKDMAVEKLTTNITADPVEVVEGETATVTVTVDVNATGVVLVEVGTNKFYADIADGKAAVDIVGLAAGDYAAKIIYLGDEKYANVSGSVSIKVDAVPEPVDSKVNVTVPDVKAGEAAKVVVELPSDATGNVIVRVDGKDAAALIVSGGTVEIPLGELTAGNHTVAVVYSGNDKYGVGVATKDIVVEKLTTNVTATPVEVVEGETATVTVTVDVNATGVVLVEVGTNKFYADIADGKAAVDIVGLTAGDYTAKVIYLGDDKYVNASGSVSIKVDAVPEPVDSKVNVTVPDVKAGEDAKVVVELPSDATGNVIVRVDGKDAAALIVSGGTVEIPLGELAAGNHTVAVVYSGNDKYGVGVATKDIVVEKLTTNVTATPVEVVEGETATVTVTVDVNATGVVLVEVGTNKFYADIADGKAAVDVVGLAAGDYTAKIIYLGDEKYANVSGSVSIKVDAVPEPVDSKVNVTVPDVKAGEDAKVVVELPSDATGNVIVRVDGKDAAALIVSGGTVEIPLGELAAGNHTVAVVYSGNDKYGVGVATKDIVVEKLTTNVTATPVEVVEGETATVTVTVDENATGTVLVEVGANKYCADISNGKAAVDVVGLTAGEYTAEITYTGDDKYREAKTTAAVKVDAQPAPKTESSIAIVEVNGYNITGILKDDSGKGIADAQIKYAVNGTQKTLMTAKDGSFVIEAMPNSPVSIDYVGDNSTKPAKTSITLKEDVAPVPVKVASRFNITGNAITIYGYAVDVNAGEHGILYSTELLDADGKPISNAYIEFAVNNKIYNRTTYENGSIDPYHLDMVRAGRYTMAFSFGGDDNYTSTFAVVCVDLDKKPITIKASAKTYKANVKTKKYTVQLKTIVGSSLDGKAHLRSGLVVKLKVNGKTYTGKTNSLGKVLFKITNLSKKASYKAKISYAGDKTYESASKTVTLKVK